jgi:YD repeat-containing protein
VTISSQTSNTLYDQNNPAKSITTVTDYFYDNFAHQQVTRIETKSSSQDVIITTKKYPPDFGSVLPYSNMTTLNIINKVIEERKTKNGATLSLEKTNYKNWNNNNYLPESIELQIKNNPIQTRATFNNYDLRGNIVEMQKENDVKTTYLWGYNKTYPVAQVVGADYATVSGLVDQSVLDNPLDEQTMKTQLNNLRNSLSIKNALVTTYTYKPLLGITSQTDANGRTVYYEYDAFGRLKVIKNHDGEIIKQYDYKYGQ